MFVTRNQAVFLEISCQGGEVFDVGDVQNKCLGMLLQTNSWDARPCVELMSCSCRNSDLIASGTNVTDWLVNIKIKDRLNFKILTKQKWTFEQWWHEKVSERLTSKNKKE